MAEEAADTLKVVDLQREVCSATLEKFMELVEEYGSIISQGDKTGPKTGLYYIAEAIRNGDNVAAKNEKLEALGFAPESAELEKLREEAKALRAENGTLKEKFQEAAAERDVLQQTLEEVLETMGQPAEPKKPAGPPPPGLPNV